ncbi:MAG: UDP-glucose/GDP-mannose dehydrogenase [Candidatus Gottesmanbacteria bacterium GW2011_GWC2_39_8]|uniref:UDP-glucose/GDP-mannose dehydrogenase n=1 Tax=Candidatus Gottesmanbacteria bacterium GW2011_GWC2_39_8 TaxID=1618450 RepID=A0A0G0Q2H0_9BACT|nr:MAG: UDP-glucose/GDP-mannose dehydrogenase [Candidatus Gottesmanbacteria bacterium GW2011_GWC2_39_8]
MKKENITVIGIGRVGLPLSLIFAEYGYKVFGIGRSPDKIEKLNRGEMIFMEKGMDLLLKKNIGKNFFPTTDYSVVKNSKYIILTLGTPVDENMNPVYDQIDHALESLIPYIISGQTLILRSTVAPKTTEYVATVITDKKGFKVGKDFYVSFCPERIAEGKSLEEMTTIPQIIGGVDKESSFKSKELFQSLGVPCFITDSVSAELTKLFTNMYRYINFAIANEFMILADNYNRNIHSIVDLVNRDYKRGGLSLPGITAGPCLFKDGFFLISDFPFNDLISTSWKINETTPLFLLKKVRERMSLKGKKVVILGLSFKPEIDDIRESLSFKLRKSLLRDMAKVILEDPYVKDYSRQRVFNDTYEAVKGADLLIFATNHRKYSKLDIQKVKKAADKDCLVCDIWNIFHQNNLIFPLNQIAS